MAEKKNDSRERTGVSENPTPEGSQPKIRWDNSSMRSTHPNTFSISVTREEIGLVFGVNQSRDARQQQARAQPTNAITLSPFTAKRLVSVLSKVIRDYEAKYGPLKVDSQPSTVLDQIASPHKKPPFSEKAGLLFHLIKNLNVEHGFERSFKISEKTLLGNRFLFTMNKHSIRQDPHGRILDICKRMDMPEQFLEAFSKNLSSANYVHLGFEENERTYIYKAYLEFWTDWENEIKNKPDRHDPFLVHLGFKWNISDQTKCALTRYTCHPSLSVENMLERLSKVFHGDHCRIPFEIAEGIVTLASGRIPDDHILYLEVEEEDNPRRSFDINMYGAKLLLEELYPLLLKMCQHYSVPSEEFHILYGQFRAKLFGHLSGGIDREGKDFLTIYYGVEGH